jgi:glycosyltransferase involved in cell wall biosynthesis
MSNRIAIILYDFTVAGGIQRTTMHCAKALAEYGFNVDIIAFFLRSDVLDSLREVTGELPNNVRLLKLRIPQAPITFINTLSRIIRVRHKLEIYDIIINMHGDVQFVKGDLIYFHQFNVDYNFFSGGVFQKAKLALLWQARKKFIEELKRDNTLIAVNSTWTKAEAIRFWNLKNVHILYPPIPFEKLRMYAGRPRGGDYVITISRFSLDRGIEEVFKLARNIPHVKFVIAGYVKDAKYFKYLLVKRPSNVVLYPNISEAFKMKLLGEAKVYLNPTPWIEGFGIAVAEGMAAGLIPITRDIGGVIDFVPKEYRFKDLDEAKLMIEKAVRNWSVRTSLQMSNLVSKFSINMFKYRLLELINKAYKK